MGRMRHGCCSSHSRATRQAQVREHGASLATCAHAGGFASGGACSQHPAAYAPGQTQYMRSLQGTHRSRSNNGKHHVKWRKHKSKRILQNQIRTCEFCKCRGPGHKWHAARCARAHKPHTHQAQARHWVESGCCHRCAHRTCRYCTVPLHEYEAMPLSDLGTASDSHLGTLAHAPQHARLSFSKRACTCSERTPF